MFRMFFFCFYFSTFLIHQYMINLVTVYRVLVWLKFYMKLSIFSLTWLLHHCDVDS